jgi:rubredoxin
MGKIWQEIHCTKSGGGCGGFVLVKLNTSLNMRAEIVCPKCKHKHIRYIVGGQIRENGRFDSSHGEVKEEICPTLAAWAEIPRTVCLEQFAGKDHVKERDGAVISSKEDLVEGKRDELGQVFLKELWAERFAGRLVGST